MEFGMLKGEVISISATPKNNEQGLLYYLVEVGFPNGLNTTYHKKLPLIQQMDGSGEIVTKDMRLIEQFIQPVKSLFKNE